MKFPKGIKKAIENVIRFQNSINGAGDVSAIVFPFDYAGIRRDHWNFSGIVVRQFQYDMDARKFRVTRSGKYHKVSFLRNVRIAEGMMGYDVK